MRQAKNPQVSKEERVCSLCYLCSHPEAQPKSEGTGWLIVNNTRDSCAASPARTYPGRGQRKPRPFPPGPPGGPRCAVGREWQHRCLLPAPALCVPRLARCSPPPPWRATFGSSFQAAAIGSRAHRAFGSVVVLNGGRVAECRGKRASGERSPAL